MAEDLSMSSTHRRFFIAMATFWLAFGLGTTVYPRMMQMFMTPAGIAASTPFSDQVWLHGGLDILSVCVLLAALSTVPATKITLRSAAVVGLLPVAAMVFTLVATPFWSPFFLVPAAGCLGFAIYGFVLAARIPATRA
jgi:hypothetical protein